MFTRVDEKDKLLIAPKRLVFFSVSRIWQKSKQIQLQNIWWKHSLICIYFSSGNHWKEICKVIRVRKIIIVFFSVALQEEGWKLNRNHYYQEGWLSTANLRGVVGVTYTTSHCGIDGSTQLVPPSRTNYNLRGHRAEVGNLKKTS